MDTLSHLGTGFSVALQPLNLLVAAVGSFIGTVVGLFMGVVGVLFMPLVGAALGEYLAQKDQHRAVRVGVATWLGIMLGLLAKVVLAFVMVGLFVAALLI